MALDNSNICIDKRGRVGIIGSILSNTAQFHVFDNDGNTGEATPTPVTDLSLAPLESIPAARRAVLTDGQWYELGHANSVPPMPRLASQKSKDE